MYFGSLGLPLPLGVIIIIPGKPSARIPESARARKCVGSSSAALGLLPQRAPALGTLACGDSA